MRRLIVVALGLFVALGAAIPASATTSVDTIVAALQKAPVYVVDGTEGTTSDTVATLTSKLSEDDNIVLVMLPSDETLSLEDVGALAEKISNGLKGERIVGIAVGTQFAGAASMLPSGIASDLMKRADTVSTNSVETLTTFIRNVHDWQRAHPELVKPPTPAKAEDGSSFAWVWIVGGVILVAIVITVIAISRRRVSARVHYTAPGNLNDPVEAMMKAREYLRDPVWWDDLSPEFNKRQQDSVTRMYDAIDLVCRYTEFYFKRFTSEKRNPDTVTLFDAQLENARVIVKEYVYAYQNHEFVEDPLDILKRGHDAIEGLADVILSTIKKGNSELLMNYKIITGIMDAERYKNPKQTR